MAGLIPQSFIDDLVGRADIVEIIDARVPLKKAGRDYTACCPFHDEKTPSFTVSPTKQFYHCFGCGAHGTVLGFLMQFEHLEFVEAVEELAARHGLEVPREGATRTPAADADARARNEAALEMLQAANTSYKRWLREHPRSQLAKDYLKNRGLSGRTAAAFEIGYAPPGRDNLVGALGGSEPAERALVQAGLLGESDAGERYDRFRDRIMFPIHDRRGRVVGFGARTLGDDTPKYLNSPETAVFHKGRELYGLHRITRLRERPRAVLVVEGYMDVVMLAEHGIDYACAALGTAATPEQMERLFRVHPDVVFCFDGDNAGRRAAWRALENALAFMRDGRSARFMFLPEGEDPDSFVRANGREGFESLMQQARSLTEFLFAELQDRIGNTSREGRARFMQEAQELIDRLPAGALKDLVSHDLSRVVGMDIARQRPQPGASSSTRAGSGSASHSGQRPSGVPSAVRRAIKLLLHSPRIARAADDAHDLPTQHIKGADLLAELLETLRERPDLTTAGLLEHFREHPHRSALMELASEEAPPETDALEEEFRDCLQAVRAQADDARFQLLRQRVNDRSASDAETREYAMLAASHGRRPAL